MQDRGAALRQIAKQVKNAHSRESSRINKQNVRDADNVDVINEFVDKILNIIQTNAYVGITRTQLVISATERKRSKKEHRCELYKQLKDVVTVCHKLIKFIKFRENIVDKLRKELNCDVHWVSHLSDHLAPCVHGHILIINLNSKNNSCGVM